MGTPVFNWMIELDNLDPKFKICGVRYKIMHNWLRNDIRLQLLEFANFHDTFRDVKKYSINLKSTALKNAAQAVPHMISPQLDQIMPLLEDLNTQALTILNVVRA